MSALGVRCRLATNRRHPRSQSLVTMIAWPAAGGMLRKSQDGASMIIDCFTPHLTIQIAAHVRLRSAGACSAASKTPNSAGLAAIHQRRAGGRQFRHITRKILMIQNVVRPMIQNVAKQMMIAKSTTARRVVANGLQPLAAMSCDDLRDMLAIKRTIYIAVVNQNPSWAS